MPYCYVRLHIKVKVLFNDDPHHSNNLYHLWFVASQVALSSELYPKSFPTVFVLAKPTNMLLTYSSFWVFSGLFLEMICLYS